MLHLDASVMRHSSASLDLSLRTPPFPRIADSPIWRLMAFEVARPHNA